MYVFLVLALPLALTFLVLAFYPEEERQETRRAIGRGLLCAIPLWFLARLLGLIVPLDWGSALLILHEWADRLLPYAALPPLAYALFFRYAERLPAGAFERRLTAFQAGALLPIGLGELIRVWGSYEIYDILFLPLIECALVLAIPALVGLFLETYGFRRVLIFIGGLLGTIIASSLPYLFLRSLWPLAALLILILILTSWFLAKPHLLKRTTVQLQT